MQSIWQRLFGGNEEDIRRTLDKSFNFDLRRRTEAERGTSIKVRLPTAYLNVGRIFGHDKIRIRYETWSQWFEDTVQQGLGTLEEVVKHYKIKPKVVLFYGELSHNALAKEALESHFVKVMIPDDEEVSILRGACLSAHHPEILQTKITMKTSASFLKEVSNILFTS